MDWHHALDIQMDTHKWQMSDTGMYYIAEFFDRFDTNTFNQDEKLKIAREAVTYLYRADTMFVTKDMLEVLLQAAHDLPVDVNFDEHMVISKSGFCVLAEGLLGEDVEGRKVTCNAIGWEVNPTLGSEENCILLYFYSDVYDHRDEYNEAWEQHYRDNGAPVPPMLLVHWFPGFNGMQVPHVDGVQKSSELVSAMCRLFIAMQLLAQQSIGEAKRLVPPRHSRKRALKWRDIDNGQTYVTLITLRRKSVKKQKEDDEPPIERSHRWLVRGHWRRQPDKHGWHWKYIYEHIKGPENKPLIISERRVFNFRR